MPPHAQMDEKRSGAARFKTGYTLKLSNYKNKWKRRFVVLTPDALHWFKVCIHHVLFLKEVLLTMRGAMTKRPDGYDLFGEERGHAKMTQILSVTIPPNNPNCFELLTVRSTDGVHMPRMALFLTLAASRSIP